MELLLERLQGGTIGGILNPQDVQSRLSKALTTGACIQGAYLWAQPRVGRSYGRLEAPNLSFHEA